MARMKDRLTKSGNAITLKSHHVFPTTRPGRDPHTTVHREMATHIGILPTDILNAVTTQLQDQPRFLRLPHPRTGMCQLCTVRFKGQTATRCPLVVFT